METGVNGAVREYMVTIRLREPLSIGARPQVGNDIHSVRYIPGTVWRGALAAEKMRRTGWRWSDSEAQAWLDKHFNSPNRFGDCRAEGSRLVTADEYRPKHGGSHPSALLRGVNTRTSAASDDEYRGPALSQEVRIRQVPRWEETQGVRTEIVMHSAVDARTGAVEPGKLFSVECVEAAPQMVFEGKSMLLESLLADELFRPVGEEGWEVEISLGRKRTSGNGRVLLSIKPKPQNGTAERLRRTQLQSLRQPFWVHVTVRSDLLLYDPFLQETLALDLAKHVLAEETSGASSGVVITKCQSWRMISIRAGWNQTWGRPKETAMCVAAGSVYSYLVKLEEPDGFDRLVDRATKAMRDGIGWRRAEGFGEIEINFGALPDETTTDPSEEATDKDSGDHDVTDKLILAVTEYMDAYGTRPLPERAIMHRISRGIVRGDWSVDGFLEKDPDRGYLANIMKRNASRTGVAEFFGGLQGLYEELQRAFKSYDSPPKGRDLLVQFILIVLAEYRIRKEKEGPQ